MKVAVGTTNPAKINAVKAAFDKIWPDETWDVVGVGVTSGVSDQPLSARESIKGATTRAKKVLEHEKADYGVGLEGGVHKIESHWFDCGWMVVIDKEGTTGIGTSIWMETPPKMMKMVHEGMELGHIDDKLFGTKNSKQGTGHFGLITNDALTRSDMYRDGVISALSRFMHPEVYE